MPAPFFKASHWLPTIRIAPGLWAVLFMFTQTAAADVLVVTDSRHPVQAPAGVHLNPAAVVTTSAGSLTVCAPTVLTKPPLT